MDSLLYYVAAHVVAHLRMEAAADRGKTAVRSDIDFVESGGKAFVLSAAARYCGG